MTRQHNAVEGRPRVSLNDAWRAAAEEELRELAAFERGIFLDRLEVGRHEIVRPLRRLYGHRADFEGWMLHAVRLMARAYAHRSPELRRLDLARSAAGDWFQRPDMLGYVAYADHLAGNLRGVEEKIPYLRELGVTYFHLMPLLEPRPGENDGGYAVADYRRVAPELGTMDDLERLAARLRQNGISLCIDLVCNHTAREHEWARRALAGDPKYQAYYCMFRDRTLPDRYEHTLLEIFPTFAPGNFTWLPEIERWVWTTFYEFQWDLDYTNPAVFCEMLDTICFLANRGVEVLRLDAVAFLWKRLGTDCQNQPEAHWLLQAFRALSRLAAPGLLHKAEAIVPPPQLVPYLGRGAAAGRECELAYHNVLMVMLWSSLAERQVALLTHTLQQMPRIPHESSWIVYLRCHDDIGWAVTDTDAVAVGLDAALHRRFLSDFYSGDYAGTFARGTVFQRNPKTGDRRINGSLASLAGLERALEEGDAREVDLAVGRILLLHGVIFAFGGIPLIYMGDEIGLLNDASYLEDPDRRDDGRWIHRPTMDWQRAEQRHDESTVVGRIFRGLTRTAAARARCPGLHASAEMSAVWTQNERVLGLLRESPRGRVLVLANFSEEPQSVPVYRLRELAIPARPWDALAERRLDAEHELRLGPYGQVWLTATEDEI